MEDTEPDLPPDQPDPLRPNAARILAEARKRTKRRSVITGVVIVGLLVASRWLIAPWPAGGVFRPSILRPVSSIRTVSQLHGIARESEERFWYYDGISDQVGADVALHEAIMFYGTLVTGQNDRSGLPPLLNLYAYARRHGYTDANTVVGFNRGHDIRAIMTEVTAQNTSGDSLAGHREYILWVENQSGHDVECDHLHLVFHYANFRTVRNVTDFPAGSVLARRVAYQPTVFQQMGVADDTERKKIAFFPGTLGQGRILWATLDACEDGVITLPFLQNLYYHPWAKARSVTTDPTRP